jgi:hypothetical protein
MQRYPNRDRMLKSPYNNHPVDLRALTIPKVLARSLSNLRNVA